VLGKLQQTLRYACADMLIVTCVPTAALFQLSLDLTHSCAFMQESHSAAVTALQAELAVSKQETLSAKADGDFSAKEAVLGADKKVQRLTERTAKASCFLLNMMFHSVETAGQAYTQAVPQGSTC